ncbi:MAG: DinB family protein [Acidobacteriota bacterium]
MEITSTESFLRYWQRIRGRTRRVVDCIPAEVLEVKARVGVLSPGATVLPRRSSDLWSLGDLIRHLALLERWMFAENIHGRPSLYRGCGVDHADGLGPVLELFEGLGAETEDLIRQLTDDQLQNRCQTPGGASLPVWKWLRAMVEHHIHHRAQIYTSLTLLGVATPPLYGLTSEEVADRSAS